MDGCLLSVSSYGRRGSGAVWGLGFDKDTTPIHEGSKHRPKAPPPDAIPLGVGISAYEFERNAHFQVVNIAEDSSRGDLTRGKKGLKTRTLCVL